MKPKTKPQYVIFAGGETAGPIMPLLAVAKFWQEKDPTILPIFLDKRKSVAARLVPAHGFVFKALTAGKLRRYMTVKNLFTPFLILIGLIQALILLLRLRPVLVMGAGGYVQVPVIIAAWMLKIPRVIHQQDIVPTFSNRLVALLANKITVTFEKSLKDFPQGTGFEKEFADSKIFWTGNPCLLDTKIIGNAKLKKEAIERFKLDPKWPTVLVIGGGSGAKGLNNVIVKSLPELLKSAQVIHSTGVGKRVETPHTLPAIHDRYHQYEFIERMDLAYAISDIVIARAGVGTITELSKLGMPSLIIPMPNSHQEHNAQYLFDHGAAFVGDQDEVDEELLAKLMRKIFFDAKLHRTLTENMMALMPADSTERMLTVINSLLKKTK